MSTSPLESTFKFINAAIFIIRFKVTADDIVAAVAKGLVQARDAYTKKIIRDIEDVMLDSPYYDYLEEICYSCSQHEHCGSTCRKAYIAVLDERMKLTSLNLSDLQKLYCLDYSTLADINEEYDFGICSDSLPNDNEHVHQHVLEPLPSCLDITAPRKNIVSFVFRQHKTGTWEIVFDGIECSSFPDRKGFHYIRHLLINRNKDLPIYTLNAAVNGNIYNVNTIHREELEDIGLREDFGWDNTEDNNTLFSKRLYYEYRELEREEEEALAAGDDSAAQIAQTKRDSIIRKLQRTKKNGRLQETKDRRRIRESIGKAIKASFEIIKAQHPALGKHFSKFLTTGRVSSHSYCPPDDFPDWRCE